MQVAQLRKDGYTQAQIGQSLGISERSVRRYQRASTANPAVPSDDTHSLVQILDSMEEHPPPKVKVGDLDPEAIACLQDLELFCDTVFPDQPLNSFQRVQARQVYEPTRWEEYDLVEGPPRHGKSHILAIMASCWRLAGGGHEPAYYLNPDNPLRNAEVILVSEAGRQVQRKFQGITSRLESPRMVKMFGRFRSAETIWQESQGTLMVEGRDRAGLSGDFSCSVVGTLGNPLGMGGDLIVIDDIASIKNCKDPAAAQKLFEWLQTMIFSRLNAGGKIVVNGHHLPVPKDLYVFLEEMKLIDEWGDDPDDVDAKPMFNLIRYSAVVQDDEGNDQPLWPRETVGDKQVGFTLKMLARAMSVAGPHTWGATWMQQRHVEGSKFCEPEWIFGSARWPGCLDIARPLGKTDYTKVGHPADGSVALRLVTIDPSPTKFAAALCIDLLPAREYSPILIDIARQRMRTLDTIMLLESWWEEYKFTHLILERNSAHYMIQDQRFDDWRRKTGVKVLYHDTGANKNDDAYGEQTIASDIAAGRVRIPWGDLAARSKFRVLIDELTEEISTNDTRMALWFPKWNLPGLVFTKLNQERRNLGPLPPPEYRPPPRVLESLGVQSSPAPTDAASRRLASVGLM
jgi:hypothetical protein